VIETGAGAGRARDVGEIERAVTARESTKEGVRLCPGSWSHSIAAGNENGYSTSVWYQNCSFNKTTGKPEFTWFKAMQGNDSFYVVQVALKVPPSEELIARWMNYLRSVRLCDTRLPDRACPADAVAPPR
jgi:hypothetical protein